MIAGPYPDDGLGTAGGWVALGEGCREWVGGFGERGSRKWEELGLSRAGINTTSKGCSGAIGGYCHLGSLTQLSTNRWANSEAARQ